MFRIDASTASGTLPTPAAPATPGYFTNGNPALGIPATIVTQDWANSIQEEMMSVLTQAGITPIKSNLAQLVAAIRACNTLNDVSASVNVLIANPSPPYSTLIIGTQAVVIPAITNTSTATLNVSSLGALAVLRPDGSVVQAGDLPAGRRLLIIYDGAAWRLINWPVRFRLGQSLTLYCNQQSGNDANTGLTLGTAFASLNGVWNWLYQNVDVTGQTVMVQCSGNFTAGLSPQTVVVGSTPSSIVFNFAVGSTISVVNQSAFFANNPGVGYTVSGPVTITATGSGAGQGCGIFTNISSQIIAGGMTFGPCTQSHVAAQYGSVIQMNGNYTIAGNAAQHFLATGATIAIAGLTVTLTGTPAFSSAFAVALWSGGQIHAVADTFSGSATGQRYTAGNGGSIDVAGGGVNYFPGSSAGSSTTGYYA